MQIRRIIVFGASGRTGKLCCLRAKKKGHHVTAIIRDPDQAKQFKDKGIHTVIFDISQEPLRAYTNLFRFHKPDVVIWAAGTSIDSLGHTIDYQAQVNVYDAMAYTCAGRVVVVGSIGTWKEGTDWPDWYDEAAKRSVGRIRQFVPHIVEAKYQAEYHLRSLPELEYTIIRPGGLTDKPAEGARMGKVGVGSTSRDLVAQLAIDCIPYPGMYRRTIDILDGEHKLVDEIREVIKEDIDTWVGE